MNYCRYHPTHPAICYCHVCKAHFCDVCSNDDTHVRSRRCFRCDSEMDSLGAANTAIPFWRRLKESFHYASSKPTLTLIAIISVLFSLFSYIPLSLVWNTLLISIFVKFCFRCLVNTANGKMYAPDITEAYEGGLTLLLQLAAIVCIMIATIIGAHIYTNTSVANLLAFVYLCIIPSVLMNLAMSENIIDAIHPLNALKLIAAIGLPYGLLLGIIAIMLFSSNILSALIGSYDIYVFTLLQSAVASFYAIVTFHIMGYVIFQYQGTLGFVAEEDSSSTKLSRTDEQKALARINIILKDGDFISVQKAFADAVRLFPLNTDIHTRYFNFLCATKNREGIEVVSTRYLTHLRQAHREELLRPTLIRTQAFITDFKPNSAELRHALASISTNESDYAGAIKILNNLHKDFPLYKDLPAAYQLMMEAMKHIPNLNDKIPAVNKLIVNLKAQADKRKKEKGKNAAQLTEASQEYASSKRIPPKPSRNKPPETEETSVFDIAEYNKKNPH